MRQTTRFSFEKALAVCHAETAAEAVGTRDAELGDTKRSSETYHEQTHGRFRHELHSHDGMVLWFLRWRSAGEAMSWGDDLPSSTFLPPPPLPRRSSIRTGGAHLCPDEVLTQSRPNPPPTRGHFLRVLGNLCGCCRQPRGSDCTADVPREPVTPQSVPLRLFSQSRKRRLLFQPL